MDLRPGLARAHRRFGVPATVTRPSPDDTPIATTVIWAPPERRYRTDEVYEYRNELDRREADRLVLGIRRESVPSVPKGTQIQAPLLKGGPVQAWRVEEHERETADEWRVVVVPA